MLRSRLGTATAAVSVLAAGLLPALLPASASAAPEAAPSAVAFPAPGDGYAAAGDDITLQGVDASQTAGLTVTGSASGVHPGKLSTLATTKGVTFNPSTDFQPGEKVTVRVPGVTVQNATGDSYTFTVATPGPPIDPNTLADGGTGTAKPQAQAAAALSCTATNHQYISRPDLGSVPGACTQGADATQPTNSAANAAADKIFTATKGSTIFDRSGQLVWYGNAGAQIIGNFQVVNLKGEGDLLTYYDGVPSAVPGSGQGEYPLLDKHYNRVHTVRAANGYKADLHEMQLTPQGTALVGSYVSVNDFAGPIIDYVVQEVEIDTGNKLFEWHALDHISTTDSHFPRLPGAPWDWIHGNSLQQTADGNLLLSGRHTWAVYKINKNVGFGNGALIWTLGGKHTNFDPITTGPGVDPSEAYAFCWQHDARELPDGSYTVFDNASAIGGITENCGKNNDAKSRGLQMAVTPPAGGRNGTAVITKVYRHDPDLAAGFAGDLQTLSDGSRFLGFGGVPQATLVDPSGASQLEVGLTGASYRAFTFPWNATPSEPPAAVVKDSSVYASWNGATQVTSWQVLTGPDAANLTPDGAPQPRTGFETQLSLTNSAAPVVRVQALDSAGKVLGTSGTPVSGSTLLQAAPATATFTGGSLNVRDTTPATGGGVNVTGADLTLPPANADYTLLFGLVPARATISLTPVDPANGRTIPLTGTFGPGGSTATFTANVHLDDYSIFGISLQGYFGAKCASMPVDFTLTSSGDARLGSVLTGTYTIPPFTGCNGAEPIVSGLLSAPGNTISLKLD